MSKIRIEGYRREGFVKDVAPGRKVVMKRIAPTTVKGHFRKDVGIKGRTPESKKIIEIKRPGRFGEGFFSMPKEEQHAILSRDAKKYGEKSTQGAMQAIATFNRRVNKPLSREAEANRSWVADNFEGKIRVKTKR